jgi:hypothetical protein
MRRSQDAAQAPRLLPLAAINEGGTRSEAAKIGGMTLEIVRDRGEARAEERPVGVFSAPDARGVDRRAKPDLSQHRCSCSDGREYSRLEEVDVGSAAHLPLQGLQAAGLALGLAIRPWRLDRGGDSRAMRRDTLCEVLERRGASAVSIQASRPAPSRPRIRAWKASATPRGGGCRASPRRASCSTQWSERSTSEGPTRATSGPSQRPRVAIAVHPPHRTTGRGLDRTLGRQHRRQLRQRLGRDGDRAIEDRRHPPPRPMAPPRSHRDRYARMGRLVQPPPPPQAHRQYQACRGRGPRLRRTGDPHCGGVGLKAIRLRECRCGTAGRSSVPRL